MPVSLNDLPDHVIACRILPWLGTKAVMRFAQTNKHMTKIVMVQFSWKRLDVNYAEFLDVKRLMRFTKAAKLIGDLKTVHFIIRGSFRGYRGAGLLPRVLAGVTELGLFFDTCKDANHQKAHFDICLILSELRVTFPNVTIVSIGHTSRVTVCGYLPRQLKITENHVSLLGWRLQELDINLRYRYQRGGVILKSICVDGARLKV